MMKKIFMLCIVGMLYLQAQSFRIEADELLKNLDSYTILDTRAKSEFEQGHIKNALNFPIQLTYENQQENGKLTSPTKMQQILRNLGLTTDSKIVVYDSGIFFDASRLFWALEVYGFQNVKILNAGYQQWQEKDYPIELKTKKTTPSNYIATINHKYLATKFTTLIATKNPNQIIIDARAKSAYEGKQSSAKRFGHIPSANNIPAFHNIKGQSKSSKLKSIGELKELYKNVDKSKKVVIYCAIGRISSTDYFALRELGYDVANYDASWKEWGNDFSLPIVGPKNNEAKSK
ncbi:sulfurtransferase [Sulfurospirillum sp. 1307]|jgi:thiosulfate/3-mercaptopyruvate sulfurtransferase